MFYVTAWQFVATENNIGEKFNSQEMALRICANSHIRACR